MSFIIVFVCHILVVSAPLVTPSLPWGSRRHELYLNLISICGNLFLLTLSKHLSNVAHHCVCHILVVSTPLVTPSLPWGSRRHGWPQWSPWLRRPNSCPQLWGALQRGCHLGQNQQWPTKWQWQRQSQRQRHDPVTESTVAPSCGARFIWGATSVCITRVSSEIKWEKNESYFVKVVSATLFWNQILFNDKSQS